MFRKLLTLYENSSLFHKQPKIFSEQLFYFFDAAENEWIGIPKTALTETEFRLLKTLYQYVEEQPCATTSSAKNWHEFLMLDGPIPQNHSSDSLYRFIQFQIIGESASLVEIETALKGFFTEEVVIIWEGLNQGIVVEEKNHTSLGQEDFQAMLKTMESDFYIKISFFIGKHYSISKQVPSLFRQEREFFSFALTNLDRLDIYTYERVFPAYLAAHLPLELKEKVIHEIYDLFENEPELFSTIKVFLENNSNASLTAKKLYIHRNTLQYRIDKFMEKTEIDLKDFHGVFTVFLACLLFEFHEGK